MIFQSSMTFHDFSRKFYFSRFSRPCGNPDGLLMKLSVSIDKVMQASYTDFVLWQPLESEQNGGHLVTDILQWYLNEYIWVKE